MDLSFTEENNGNGSDKMHVFISNMEKLQFEYFNGRPEWTAIDISNLKLFMAYSYFGNPNIQNDIEDDTDIFELYKENEKECIIDMFEIIKRRIIKRASKVMVGITMVHSICKENCKYCYSGKKMLTHVWLLLRIKNEQSVVYIDVYHMRTYKDFNDYVQNNELPPGFMYFPKSGMYEEKEYLLTELTPPSRKVESVMSTLDSVGTIINFAGGAVITAGLFYTVATPILISTSIAAATACTYDVYRQTRSLSRINEHNGSLLCRQSIEHWLNLGISLLGTVTAPLGAASRVIETQGLKAGKIFKFGRSFNPFQKGLYITQQSLEIIRFFVKVINKKEVTIKNLLELRLDLFVVTGFLQPINHVRKIISVMAMKILNFDESIFRLVTEIPYYVGQHIMQSPIFVKEHLKQFIGKLENFVCKNFTMDKLLWAYKAFSELMNVYRQQSATLRGPELLHHVVHDLMVLPCDLNAKKALSGKQMTELLKELGITDDRRDIEFCVRYVVGIADELQTEYRDVIALLVGRGYMDFDQNEAEFCKQYKLSACTYTEFVLYGIRRTVAEGQNEFWRKYGARPKTVYDELLVANCVRGTQSLETFTTTAPPSDTSLSANFCRQVASSIDPANHSKYSNSQHLSLPNNISVLCDSSVLGSVRIVLFYVHSTPDRPRSLNVCIYNKSKGNPMLRFP